MKRQSNTQEAPYIGKNGDEVSSIYPENVQQARADILNRVDRCEGFSREEFSRFAAVRVFEETCRKIGEFGGEPKGKNLRQLAQLIKAKKATNPTITNRQIAEAFIQERGSHLDLHTTAFLLDTHYKTVRYAVVEAGSFGTKIGGNYKIDPLELALFYDLSQCQFYQEILHGNGSAEKAEQLSTLMQTNPLGAIPFYDENYGATRATTLPSVRELWDDYVQEHGYVSGQSFVQMCHEQPIVVQKVLSTGSVTSIAS